LCLLNAYHNLIIYIVKLGEVAVVQGRGEWDGIRERVLLAAITMSLFMNYGAGIALSL
jgi:hypothetical protein